MAIVPLLVNMAREIDQDSLDFYDDDFGFGIHPMDIFRPRRSSNLHSSLMLHPRRRYNPYESTYLAARRHLDGMRGGAGPLDGISSSAIMPSVTKDGFQVCINVSQFKPNELTVKTVDKNIIVEGKHEEREDDHGMIQRHFVRKYTLPKDYDPKDVVSTISSDGVLTVKAAPPPSKAIEKNERIVQIQQTGPAHLSVKAPEQQQKDVHNGENQQTQQQQKQQQKIKA